MRLSGLSKTWLFDLDGTLVVHNGYSDGGDRLLPGVHSFMRRIALQDCVVVLSAREEALREPSLAFLRAEGVRVDRALFGLPYGERILLNDRKPSGLRTAHAIDLPRDQGLEGLSFERDPSL